MRCLKRSYVIPAASTPTPNALTSIDLDFTSPDTTAGPAFIINPSATGFDVDNGVAAAALNFTWANRVLYGALSYTIDVSGYTGRFLALLNLVNTTTYTDEGLIVGAGFGNAADPAAATVGGLFGADDTAGGSTNITSRSSGDLWGTLNSLNAAADTVRERARLDFRQDRTAVAYSSVTFANTSDVVARNAAQVNAALDVSGGTLYVYIFGGLAPASAPAADLAVALTAQLQLVDLA